MSTTEMISVRARFRLLAMGLIIAATTTSATADPVTAVRTDTFNPGFFWSTFTYGYTITAAPTEIPFNDFEIQFKSLANVNTGSYTGPGAVQAPPAGNPNLFRVVTAAPGGFANPVTFTITSVANPNVVEGIQSVTLTLGGAPVAPAVNTTFLRPGARPNNAATGVSSLSFDPGTFLANAQVDLFQSTVLAGQTAHLGYGSALSDGSATISLFRPLILSDLVIGENGRVINAIVPEPATLAMLGTGLLSLLVLTGRRRQSVATTRAAA